MFSNCETALMAKNVIIKELKFQMRSMQNIKYPISFEFASNCINFIFVPISISDYFISKFGFGLASNAARVKERERNANTHKLK